MNGAKTSYQILEDIADRCVKQKAIEREYQAIESVLLELPESQIPQTIKPNLEALKQLKSVA